MNLKEAQQKAYSELWKATGAFFAFGNKQFYESYDKDSVPYISCGAGLYVPKKNYETMNKGMKAISKKHIAMDLAENGRANIIKRELANYEWNIDDTVEALKPYGITYDEIVTCGGC